VNLIVGFALLLAVVFAAVLVSRWLYYRDLDGLCAHGREIVENRRARSRGRP